MSNTPTSENLPPVSALREQGIKNPADCWTDVLVHGFDFAARYYDTTPELLKRTLKQWLPKSQ